MLLREHPDMTFRAAHSWPPTWIKLYRGWSDSKGEVLRGEIGFLQDSLHYTRLPTQIFLIMRHEGAEYMAVLLFDDASFCQQVAARLNSCSGMSIEAIGALEFDKQSEPPYVI
jgi:hypothetical protein